MDEWAPAIGPRITADILRGGPRRSSTRRPATYGLCSQAKSKPLVADLRAWFEEQITKLPARGPTAEAIRYALNHWDGLERFLEERRIELDTNCVERTMRPVALSRKNSLFAGSDEGGEYWAYLASLIETCTFNGLNPQSYRTDPLTLLVNGWPQQRNDDVMRWYWASQPTPSTATCPEG